jgi:hypothetical protein
MAFSRSLLLPIGFTTFLLSVDAAVSLGLVSSMVAFLHGHGQGPFTVAPPDGSPFLLFGEPANLVTDQGHTTNAAGGTALVLVGLGGIIALWRERFTRKKVSKLPPLTLTLPLPPLPIRKRTNQHSPQKWDRTSRLFYIWSLIVLLSFLLTMTALIYTFAETTMTSGQAIDLSVAQANPPPARYPDGRWTPENWYAAVLDLPLASANQRRVIGGNLGLMRAWRWNIVALFVLGFVLVVLVALEVWRVRRRNKQAVSMVEVLAEPAKPRV